MRTLNKRGVREFAMLTLTLFSRRREIVHDVTAPQGIELARTLKALQSQA